MSEKFESQALPIIENFKYNLEGGANKFPEVIEFKEIGYDLRIDEGDTATYRMTNEARTRIPEPSYIKVNTKGEVLEQWND